MVFFNFYIILHQLSPGNDLVMAQNYEPDSWCYLHQMHIFGTRKFSGPFLEASEDATVGELQQAIRQQWQLHEKTRLKVVHDTAVLQNMKVTLVWVVGMSLVWFGLDSFCLE